MPALVPVSYHRNVAIYYNLTQSRQNFQPGVNQSTTSTQIKCKLRQHKTSANPNATFMPTISQESAAPVQLHQHTHTHTNTQTRIVAVPASINCPIPHRRHKVASKVKHGSISQRLDKIPYAMRDSICPESAAALLALKI